MLLLFLAAPRSEATAIFDFSGVCASGDCDPGSTVTGELRFSDDADLSHRNRLVTGADFVSLALGFATVGKARATAHWSPASEGGIIQPIEVAIDAAGAEGALSAGRSPEHVPARRGSTIRCLAVPADSAHARGATGDRPHLRRKRGFLCATPHSRPRAHRDHPPGSRLRARAAPPTSRAERPSPPEVARQEYDRFLQLWKNADEGLPELNEARAYVAE